MKAGKLKESVLKRSVLKQLHKRNDKVLTGPSVGCDYGAIDVTEDEAVVLSTDPITASAVHQGSAAIYAATNDVAASGAIPQGVSVSLLLPTSFNEEELRDIVKDMEKPNDNVQEKENPHFDCGFIVTDGKRIFTVDSDLEVNEQSRWAAIGCTEMMAYACFMGAAHNEEPNETILKSLRVSTRRNDGVGAPFILVNTLDNEIEIVEE
jgi:hypothetical protein